MQENMIACDSLGVIYKGRTENMSKFKEEFAAETDKRTLEEALKGADIFFGCSAAGALKEEFLASMAENPIVFALANPEPEIRPEVAQKVRPDVIIATGRSDYPNQLSNINCFPYLFRGTLDTRSPVINQHMMMAAAVSLAMLAREPVLDEVATTYDG